MTTRPEQINRLIRRIGIVQRRAADAWVRESGLTMTQGLTVGYIERNQERGVIAREIAEISGTTAASVASLIQGLEDRGLVERRADETDSRRKLLYATPEAVTLVRDFDAKVHAADDAAFGVLTAKEQDQLIALLAKIAEATDVEEAPER